MTQTVRSILIVLSFPIGLGLIFLVFRLLSRAFVTGVAPSGPISRQGKKQRKLGDYTILSELGRGGMGTVFKAVGQQGRTVAIKVIGGMHTDRRAGARGTNRVGLVHEARLAASLRHPNIVSIFDVRREKHTLYVVMEYLEGTPLSLYIRQRTPSVPEALRIIAEVCDALKYAHARGIIHRDIKPANIFITTNNTVKILDFGLAVRGDYRAGFGGTPPYMSPEQLTGTELDARTDIWSAGVTLFEVLTGRCPFAAENLFALRAKITDGRLPELPPELPCVPNLQTILGKALAKDREARYKAASQFGMELRSLILEIERGYPKAPLSVLIPNLPDRPLAGSVANASERSLVNLGFREQVNTKVVLIKSPQRLWFDAYNISSLRAWGNIIQTAGSSLVMLGLSVAFAMHQFWRPALEFQVGFL